MPLPSHTWECIIGNHISVETVIHICTCPAHFTRTSTVTFLHNHKCLHTCTRHAHYTHTSTVTFLHNHKFLHTCTRHAHYTQISTVTFLHNHNCLQICTCHAHYTHASISRFELFINAYKFVHATIFTHTSTATF